jgi:hypothetical protein
MTSQYDKYVKPRLENDPEYKAKYLEAHSLWCKQMYHNNDEYREKTLQRTKACMKERYENDPEYRERQKQKALQRYYAKKALKSSMLQNTVHLVC